MINKSHIIILLLLALILSNCSVSKRHYRKGYHVVWNTGSHGESREVNHQKHPPAKNRLVNMEKQLDRIVDITRTELTASADQVKEFTFKKFKPKRLEANNDSCADIIVFRNGEEIKAKIVEVYNGTVRYLPCDNLEGPLRVANGEKIFMIKYANGTKEIFKEPAKTNTVQTQLQKPAIKKMNGFAMASFICSWFSLFFVPAIVAVILGVIALNQISKYPDKYKNKWMAKTGLIIGGIVCFLYLLTFVYG